MGARSTLQYLHLTSGRAYETRNSYALVYIGILILALWKNSPYNWVVGHPLYKLYIQPKQPGFLFVAHLTIGETTPRLPTSRQKCLILHIPRHPGPPPYVEPPTHTYNPLLRRYLDVWGMVDLPRKKTSNKQPTARETKSTIHGSYGIMFQQFLLDLRSIENLEFGTQYLKHTW